MRRLIISLVVVLLLTLATAGTALANDGSPHQDPVAPAPMLPFEITPPFGPILDPPPKVIDICIVIPPHPRGGRILPVIGAA